MMYRYVALSLLVSALYGAEKNKSVYPDTVAPKINFELINKSDAPIAINVNALKVQRPYYHITLNDTLESSRDTIKGSAGYVEIKPKETFSAQIDLNQPTKISIAPVIKQTPNGSAYPSGVEEYSIDAKGKTRYLSYNASKKELERLYPQTGPLKGAGKFTPNFILEDRTNSGLLKRNNVSQKDIALVSKK